MSAANKKLVAMKPGSVSVGDTVLCTIDLHGPKHLCVVTEVFPTETNEHFKRSWQAIKAKTPWNISYFTLHDFGGEEVFSAE